MYDIERQELGSDEPLVEETAIDDSQMGDLSGATEAPSADPATDDLPVDELGADLPLDELVADLPADEAAAEAAKPKDNRNWFVVHTYSGYENKVKANLERRIHSMGMQDKIFRVLVPMEDEVEFKDGKRKITPKKVFPGYVLVEAHDEEELRRAVAAGARLVGINNRNLRTLETDLAVSAHLLPKVPPGVIAVSESGMRDASDVARLRAAGARGFLIGEALMRSDDPGALISALRAGVRPPLAAL